MPLKMHRVAFMLILAAGALCRKPDFDIAPLAPELCEGLPPPVRSRFPARLECELGPQYNETTGTLYSGVCVPRDCVDYDDRLDISYYMPDREGCECPAEAVGCDNECFSGWTRDVCGACLGPGSPERDECLRSDCNPSNSARCEVTDMCGSCGSDDAADLASYASPGSGRLIAGGWPMDKLDLLYLEDIAPSSLSGEYGPVGGHNSAFMRSFAQCYSAEDLAQCGSYSNFVGLLAYFEDIDIDVAFCNQTIDFVYWAKDARGLPGAEITRQQMDLLELRRKQDRSVNPWLQSFLDERLSLPPGGLCVGFEITQDVYGQIGTVETRGALRCEGEVSKGHIRYELDGPWVKTSDVAETTCGIDFALFPILGACQPCDTDVSAPGLFPVHGGFGESVCPVSHDVARPWLNADICGVCSGNGSSCRGHQCPPMTGVSVSVECQNVRQGPEPGQITVGVVWSYENTCNSTIVVPPNADPEHGPLNYIWSPDTELPPATWFPVGSFHPGCDRHALVTEIVLDAEDPVPEIVWTVESTAGFSWEASTEDPQSQRSCTVGCDGVAGSGWTEDECGVCRGPKDPLRDTDCADCLGVPNGSAVVDTCGVCNGRDECLPQGSPCGPNFIIGSQGSTYECAEGLSCLDGYCCPSDCTGDCQRCDVPGMYGMCMDAADGTDPRGRCDNGVFCDGQEACQAGVCEDGDPLGQCDDGNSCTIDFCVENSFIDGIASQCRHEPVSGTGSKCHPLQETLGSALRITPGVPTACSWGVQACVDEELCCINYDLQVEGAYVEGPEFPDFCGDGIDNNCDGTADEGCANFCNPESPEDPAPPPLGDVDTSCNSYECTPDGDGFRWVLRTNEGAPCTPDSQCIDASSAVCVVPGENLSSECVGEPLECTEQCTPEELESGCFATECDASSGCVCAQSEAGSPCDDGSPLTADDKCISTGECVGRVLSPAELGCNQLDQCLAVSLGPEGECIQTPDTGASCDDDTTCTANDTCDEEGECTGTPVCAEMQCFTLTCVDCTKDTQIANMMCSGDRDFQCVYSPSNGDPCTTNSAEVGTCQGGICFPSGSTVSASSTTTVASTISAAGSTTGSASTSSSTSTTGEGFSSFTTSTAASSTIASAMSTMTSTMAAGTSTSTSTTGSTTSASTTTGAKREAMAREMEFRPSGRRLLSIEPVSTHKPRDSKRHKGLDSFGMSYKDTSSIPHVHQKPLDRAKKNDTQSETNVVVHNDIHLGKDRYHDDDSTGAAVAIIVIISVFVLFFAILACVAEAEYQRDRKKHMMQVQQAAKETDV